MQVTPLRSYRCTYSPQTPGAGPAASETGVLPFVQVKACTAEHAQRLAYAVTGCPIAEVTRIETADEVAA